MVGCQGVYTWYLTTSEDSSDVVRYELHEQGRAVGRGSSLITNGVAVASKPVGTDLGPTVFSWPCDFEQGRLASLALPRSNTPNACGCTSPQGCGSLQGRSG